MKKYLLLLSFLPLGAIAQVSDGLDNPLIKKGVPCLTQPSTGCKVIHGTGNQNISAHSLNKLPDVDTVGITGYDLQTNASTARRIIVYPDGKISTVWTNAPDKGDKSFPDRGAGYNHFNGTSWMQLSDVENRLEKTQRTGWPNISAVGSPQHELILSHMAIAGGNSGGFDRLENTSVGGTTWSEDTIFPTGPIWGRTAQGGNNHLYLIGTYSDTNKIIGGVKTPTVLFISDDNGKSWKTKYMLLPGFAAQYPTGNGDDYAIDAQDSHVVVLYGEYFSDLTMWKSSDYGATWTRTVIDTLPYDNVKKAFTATDSFRAICDGSQSVVLDDKNVAHVFWGTRYINITKDTSTYSVYYYLNGITYWNDRDTTQQVIGGVLDEDKSGKLELTSGFYYAAPTGGSLQIYGQLGLATMPSGTVDSKGNVYCVYQAMLEGTHSWSVPNGAVNYSDIYVNYSKDGGKTWSQSPQNISKLADAEDAFPCVAKVVDSKLHVQWQRDDYPSTYVGGLITSGGQYPNRQQQSSNNSIIVSGVDVADILADAIGSTSINEKTKYNKAFSFGEMYPNPATSETYLELNLSKASFITLSVVDITGKTVMNSNYGTQTIGKHTLGLNTSTLVSGVYFIKVSAAGYTSTQKLVIE